MRRGAGGKRVQEADGKDRGERRAQDREGLVRVEGPDGHAEAEACEVCGRQEDRDQGEVGEGPEPTAEGGPEEESQLVGEEGARAAHRSASPEPTASPRRLDRRSGGLLREVQENLLEAPPFAGMGGLPQARQVSR